MIYHKLLTRKFDGRIDHLQIRYYEMALVWTGLLAFLELEKGFFWLG